MSPKTDSKTANVLTRTAWSRDVKPNTSGVMYSRRSYYYDREFSDSIVRPTDRFESPLSGRSTAHRYLEEYSDVNKGYRNESTFVSPDVTPSRTPRSGTGIAEGQLEEIFARPASRRSSDWIYKDAFLKGRVLQSASAGGHGDDRAYELQECSSPKPAQAPSGGRSQVPTEPEPGLTIAGFDLQTIAQGAVVAADVLVRIAEAYQRIRDSDGLGAGSEDDAADEEFFGLNLDPYHLEAGPPRRLRPPSRMSPRRVSPGRKTVAQRAQIATSSAMTVASPMDGPQGSTSHQNNNATTTRSVLPPLPASKRVCYYLIATVLFGVLASFGIALWWAQSQGDVSAAFTIGGYVIAVDALVIAVAGMVHRPGCRCWKV